MRFILIAVAMIASNSGSAQADDCGGGARSSLAGPPTRCVQPIPTPNRARTQRREEPKSPPGTFRAGNTTITVHGSVTGEATTRSR